MRWPGVPTAWQSPSITMRHHHHHDPPWFFCATQWLMGRLSWWISWSWYHDHQYSPCPPVATAFLGSWGHPIFGSYSHQMICLFSAFLDTPPPLFSLTGWCPKSVASILARTQSTMPRLRRDWLKPKRLTRCGDWCGECNAEELVHEWCCYLLFGNKWSFLTTSFSIVEVDNHE